MTQSLQVGSLFAGRLRIERKLGAGGMGVVYEVTQTSTGQRAALKLLAAEGCFDDDVRARFLQEARRTPSDVSEHIVRVYDADITDGRPWILMELLDGVTLREMVEARGRLSVASMLDVMEQLCHGLGGAHARGIVHRDLKPENIFVTASKRAGGGAQVKLLDFGVAKVLRAPRVATSASVIVGTEGWWAPEQAFGTAVSPATDVWALGLLAYWMLTGAQYMDADHSLARLSMSASDRSAAQGRAGTIPPGFDAWFAQCVASSVSERFVDANVALNALRAALHGSSQPRVASPSPDVVAPVSQRPALAPPARAPSVPHAAQPRSSGASWWVGSIAVLLTLLALSVLGASWLGAHSTNEHAERAAQGGDLLGFLQSWDASRRSLVDIERYYAPRSRFRGGKGIPVRPEEAALYWHDFAALGAVLRPAWSTRAVTVEPLTSPDAAQSCREIVGDDAEITRVEFDVVEDNPHSQTGCARIADRYFLRLRRVGGRYVICHESHVLRTLCAACPNAPGCPR